MGWRSFSGPYPFYWLSAFIRVIRGQIVLHTRPWITTAQTLGIAVGE